MLRRFVGLAGALVSALALSGAASAQDVTLKIHQFLPAPAPVPKNFIAPWAEKVTAESNGRIKFELYPAMQLGGAPPGLYDQARDGVVDIVWTLAGYTPGRFPKSEVFDMPFLAASAEATSQAAWEFYQKHLVEEFADTHVLAVHTHGPGLLHVKGDGVTKLEDMKGLKLRGPTRIVTQMLSALGATPVGMPVPAMPEALSKGVIDGTVVPWEVTTPLKVAELVNTHTTFAGSRALYTTFFLFTMNKDSYAKLPDDLKKVIDANSGMATAKWVGKVMDDGDLPGLKAAQARNNKILTLDAAETARWKAAAQPVIDNWVKDMQGKGVDGAALLADAKALVAKYAGAE